MKTVGTFFTGGGVGLARLPKNEYSFSFGVEFDAKIAAYYCQNISDNIRVGRVQDVPARELPSLNEST